MSLAELKERVAKLTPRERLLLSSFLAELEEADEHGFRSKADERMKAMDAGRKVDMADFERRHEDLKAKGL